MTRGKARADAAASFSAAIASVGQGSLGSGSLFYRLFRGNWLILTALLGAGLIQLFMAPPFGLLWLAAAGGYWYYADFRHRLKESQEVRALEAQRTIPPRSRPPTPEETRQAVGLMNLAQTRLNAYWKAEGGAIENLKILEQASQALTKARKLDPLVEATVVPDTGQPILYTLDRLSAQLLYIEALSHFKQAEIYLEQKTPEEILDGKADTTYNEWKKSNERTAEHFFRNSLAPAHRAVIYSPYNSLYISQLAKSFKALGFDAEAKQCIDRAYKISPDDPDILALML